MFMTGITRCKFSTIFSGFNTVLDESLNPSLGALQNSGKSPTACCGDVSHKMLFTKINKYYMLYTNYIVLD